MRTLKSFAPPRGRTALAIVATALFVASAATAGTISDIVLRVDVQSSLGTGSYEVEYDPANYDPDTGTYNWALAAPVEILNDADEPIVTIQGLSTFLMVDPVINLGFLVTAGGADTTITITSALISFGPIANPTARASAQAGSTDLNGNGVALTGQYSGGKGYIANYNGLAPGGSNFATVVDSQSGGAWFSTSDNEDFPPAGFQVIPDVVSSMSAQYSYRLTANDQASGTSVYVLVPEPASMVLLLCGVGIAALRRR